MACTASYLLSAGRCLQPGALGKLISVGVLLVSVVLNFLMFGDPDVFNLLINAVLFYILFIKKIPRKV